MYVLYFINPLVSAMLCAVAALYGWRHRKMHSATSFAVLMTFASAWAGGYALQVVSPNEGVAQLIDRIYFSAIILLPSAWAIFALSYTDSWSPTARRCIPFLALIPVVSLILNWVTPLRPLFFETIRFQVQGSLLIPHRTNGPWFYVHALYNYALIALGMYLLVRQAVQTFQIYRLQALTLLFGAIAPLIPNILVSFQLVNIPITYIGFAISGLIYGWALFRYQLLDLVPVAREKLIDNMTDGMLLLDAQQRVLDFNPTMQELLSLPPKQAIGRSVSRVLRDYPHLLHQLEGEESQESEIRLAMGAETRHYDLRTSVLSDQLGQATGRLVVLHDITQRKASEEALQRYTEELEASNAELDAFAHTVAHDLKNPLSALVGYTHLIESRHARMSMDMLIQNLQTIGRNARKMANIIEELLLLSSVRKVEDVETGTVEMDAIVNDAVHRLDDMIKDYDAVINIQDQWPKSTGYGPWIEEVWVNYLSNALKYGGEPPQVEIGAMRLATNGRDKVRFWVQDNGDGLTPEEQGKLFAQFERLNQTRAEGHGLGLSIVQRIMDKLGGDVGVESQVGEGSRFWFTLPAAAEFGSRETEDR
jgi:PAS domain S-box-containing protein